jgi:hypothetical protein
MKLPSKLVLLAFVASMLACKTADSSGANATPARISRYDGGSGRDTSAAIGDLVVCRPLGVFATAGGTMLFLFTLPFTWPAGSIEASAQTLVYQPMHYTFQRPLGDFNE